MQAADRELVPLLWVCGTSGVGKSTVAWELFGRSARDRVATAYVDIDQLGMSFPPPADDETRDRIKALNLGGAVFTFRAAGAERIIVSGVIDPASAGMYVEALAGVRLTWCQLNVAPATLRERLVLRGWPPETIAYVLDYARALDASGFAHATVNTDGMSVSEVVEAVAGEGLKPDVGLACEGHVPATEDSEERFSAILITGGRAVGKSTVAWEVYERTRAAGVRTAFLDLRQLSFFRPPAISSDPSNDALKVQNVAALWPNFHADGARRLILNGELRRPAGLQAALPRADLTTYVLTASDERLRERANTRASGGGPGLVGDEDPLAEHQSELTDAPPDHPGSTTIDTTDLTPDEIASHIVANTDGWLGSRWDP